MIPVVVLAVFVAVVATTLSFVGLTAAAVLRVRDLSASVRDRTARLDRIGAHVPVVTASERERIRALQERVSAARGALPGFDQAADRATSQLAAAATAGAAVGEGIRTGMERLARLAELARVLWWAR